MFEFYWPWFALLIPFPLIFFFFRPPRKQENTPQLYFPALERLQRAFPAHQAGPLNREWLFYSILYLAWVCLILALMQPEKVDQINQVKNRGYDLMLAVDISASMQAVDFSTHLQTISRLDATKEVVSRFVRGRQGDRVGLISFGEHAYLHVPLTLDTLSVSKMLEHTLSGMAGNGTAIGDAIGLSVKTLRERPEGSRVLILLTDGVDNSSRIPPKEAAKLAKQYGIKIYTIGVGSYGPVPFPTKHGGIGMAEVPMDEELLKEIAAMTGGQYYHAADQKALQSIYATINQLEKTEAEMSIILIRDPLYRYPLLMSVLLITFLTSLQLARTRFGHGF